MFERLTQRWLHSSPQLRSAEQIEDDVRRELAELERQTVAFHEAIGLLRATLSFASHQEHEGHQRMQRVGDACAARPKDDGLLHDSIQLSHLLAIENWQRDRLYAHTLRQLYHRLLEAKRRFLYQWHQHLMRQVLLLPEARQAPMTALLDNSLQGILAVGVGQVEAQYTQEIEQMLAQTLPPEHLPQHAHLHHDSLSAIDALLAQMLSQQATDTTAATNATDATDTTDATSTTHAIDTIDTTDTTNDITKATTKAKAKAKTRAKATKKAKK